jgi:hypothetical protein
MKEILFGHYQRKMKKKTLCDYSFMIMEVKVKHDAKIYVLRKRKHKSFFHKRQLCLFCSRQHVKLDHHHWMSFLLASILLAQATCITERAGKYDFLVNPPHASAFRPQRRTLPHKCLCLFHPTCSRVHAAGEDFPRY